MESSCSKYHHSLNVPTDYKSGLNLLIAAGSLPQMDQKPYGCLLLPCLLLYL